MASKCCKHSLPNHQLQNDGLVNKAQPVKELANATKIPENTIYYYLDQLELTGIVTKELTKEETPVNEYSLRVNLPSF